MMFFSFKQTSRTSSRVSLTTFFALLVALPAGLLADSERAASFLPTWRLLDNQEKQQFIAGYLHAWKDAERVTGIVLEHLKANPDDTLNSLTRLQDLYDLSGLDPQKVVAQVDRFYSHPDNRDVELSAAVSLSRKVSKKSVDS